MITSTKFFLPIAASISAILLATASRVEAFGGPPGGPFSNGSYFPNDGTFAAVVRGTNLSGTLQFSTTASSGPAGNGGAEAAGGADAAGPIIGGGTGSTGIANVYYNGKTYTGNSQGAYNGQGSRMQISFQAGSAGQGEQQLNISRVVDLGDTVEIATTINPDGTVVSTETITPNREVVTAREIRYFDSFYINGYASCKTSNSFPNQKFQGTGQVVAQQINFSSGNSDPVLDTSAPIPVSITGVRLSNTSSSFATSEVVPPSINVSTVLIP